MVEIGGYEFEGVHSDGSDIKMQQGVYVVVCLVDGEPHCVLDIGTSGQLQKRVKGWHTRQSCWNEYVHGEIGFCVKYTGAGTDVDYEKHAPPSVRKSEGSTRKDRLLIEDELFWKFDVPCGTNPWLEHEKAIARYNAYQQLFGPRGHSELD